jgi:hypothetical protein
MLVVGLTHTYGDVDTIPQTKRKRNKKEKKRMREPLTCRK